MMLTSHTKLINNRLNLAATTDTLPSFRGTEPAIFFIAGLLTVTIGSILCSKSPSATPNWQRALVQYIWAVSAITLALGHQAFYAVQLGGFELPPPVVVFTAAIEMLSLLRTILAFLPTISTTIIAKRTIFWKLFHISRGTFQSAIRSFHEARGDVIQIAPQQYSISKPAYFQRCAQLEQMGSSLATPISTEPGNVAELLAEALTMANIFSYERDIERCNIKLADTFNHHATTGDTIKLSNLLTRYIFDVLFATTTGQMAGFLDRPADITKLLAAMKTWKFYSVLHGTYLRFHPVIDKVARVALGSDEALSLVLERLPDINDAAGGTIAYLRRIVDIEDEEKVRQVLIASAALIISASDPLITHLMTTIYHVYRTPELLQALRQEILSARIYQPPRLRYILKSNDRLPLLHAVLKETLRLHPICTPEYDSPDGGVMIGDTLVPANCTIYLQPSITHQDPSVFGPAPHMFDPHRWLQDASVVGPMKSHLLAFGAGNHNHQHEDLHYALLVKLLIQILPNIDLDMAATMMPTSALPTIDLIREHLEVKVKLPRSSSSNNTPSSPLRATAPAFAPETMSAPELPPTLSFSNAARYISSLTLGKLFTPSQVSELAAAITPDSHSPTLSTASVATSNHGVTPEDKAEMARLLGDNATKRLLESFSLTQPLINRPPVRTWEMRKPRQRALAHELIERVWQGRLGHTTDSKTNRMWIELKQERVATNGPLQDSRNQKVADKPTPVATRPPPVVHSGWGAFAGGEEAKHAAARAEGDAIVADPGRYAAQRKKFADVFAEKQEANKEAPDTKFNTVFKQTSLKETTNGKLGGPRKLIAKGNENEGSNETTSTLDVTESSIADDAGGITLPAKPAFLPPHLRKRAVAAETTTTATTIIEATNLPAVESKRSTPAPTTQERTTSPATEAPTALLYVPPQVRGRSVDKRVANDSPVASPAPSPSESTHTAPVIIFKQRGSPSPAASPSKRPARSVTPPHLRKRSISPPQAEAAEWVAARLPLPFA